VLLVLIGLIILSWLAIQTTPVQNWLVRQVTHKLSKNLNATVRIEHVDFSLFNKMHLEGTLVQDQQKDTLLYAGNLTVNITDWFFLKDKIELKYIGLKDATIHLQRSDSVWNYRFLVDYFSSPGTKAKKGGIELNLKTVEFENVTLLQHDKWRGEDQSLQFASLDIDAEQVSFLQKKIHINSILVDRPVFSIYNYTGNRPPRVFAKKDPLPIINDPGHLRWNPSGWDIAIDLVKLNDGIFKSDRHTDRLPTDYFDGQHILFTKINGEFRNTTFRQDSIRSSISLNTKERSGLIVKKLMADMTMHPEAMEFEKLDIQTNRSRLTNYFAMRYESFNDMSDFVSKVRMEANFDEAALNSDDIAYFAPALESWKKNIRITGRIKGPVDNLVARNLIVEAGRDTYLNGNIALRGLPYIDKTYIDFVANDFRTNYPDAVLLLPQLKNITHPRLDKLEYMRFRGNFLGFVKDFVTYGTLQTNLGLLQTDMNMKFPDNGLAVYSGTIKTESFDLGTFMNFANVGRINFAGKIEGRGLTANNLNAKLDGNIRSLEMNGYTYSDMVIKGDVAKRLFNGELVINDPKLKAKLNGLIDFSKDLPAFNFNADVTHADLKNIQLVKDSIEVKGKFVMNFTGDNIDNFLGTARIYDASVYKNGQRITFDSLNVESKAMGSNKVITVLSNEFDGVLVGEFSIGDLPASFSTFLNKYFPAYIKPAHTVPQNENFSFVITTKKVDEYLDFIHKDLGGFNYSTITGRINSHENLLDLNAEVPQFNYKNIFFYNLNLKGTGNLDTLSMKSSIADIYINDSLHFPGTEIEFSSSNDVSLVNIKTGANQTLNSASLSGRVHTMRDGVRIVFNESNFDVNGKTWTIDKKGEMVLSKQLVSADGVKLYNGQQEILITTHPSDIGNTNDIKVALKKINIGDFTPYVVKKNRLEGLLTANVDIMDPFGKMQIDVSGQADQFRLDDDSIGRLDLNANYAQRTNKINFSALSENKDYAFDLRGMYNLADSATSPLDIVVDFKETRINLLDKYLSGVFSDINGYATGGLRISGPTNKLKYLGNVHLRDGEMRVKYTNVLYKIPSANFNFTDGQIDFGSFVIRDQFGNSGSISRGILKHEAFNNLNFDFALNTNKLLVLATNNSGKDPFFGTVFARANATFRGPLENMRLDVRGEPADSSKLYIRSGSGRESDQADFIVWKVYGREMTPPVVSQESNLRVFLDVTANNYANMYVILDELTGDIIEANGHGNLKMQAGTDGEFNITGRYEIDRGNYNFNFQSLLRKPFKLSEGVGNYIQWSGDPYDADIKIDAEYTAENVRFSDLGDDLFAATGSSTRMTDNVRKYRGEVLVIATLTQKLMQPNIAFRIELPQGSALKNDPNAAEILRRIESDVNELNKQVAFLIVFNSFGPLSTSNNQGGLANLAFEGVVVNSISGVLSNAMSKQFSSIFQKIFNDKSIKVNFNAQLYSGSNFIDNIDRSRLSIDRTNLNFNIGKSFINERLTFSFGSALDFGLSSQQVQATKNLQFLPDITAEWKIRPDGKLVLTFFYRDSYNYLAGTTGARQNRSGASISWRRDFDRISDLWRKSKKKKVKEKSPAPADTTNTTKTEGGSN
jgi:hypothetical protein